MNTDFLLDAIGLIDDDLILDAEQQSVGPKVVPFRTKLTAWAACLAVVVVLGYGITHLPLMGSKSDSASTGAAAPSSPAASAPASSAPAADAPSESTPSSPSASIPSGDSSHESNLVGFRVMVTLDSLTYAYSHTYPYEEPHGAWVDALPEGCRHVGYVESIDDDITVPHTDIGVHEGCALWLEGEGKDSTLYLELPEGIYLVCEYSQTYDFSPGGTG